MQRLMLILALALLSLIVVASWPGGMFSGQRQTDGYAPAPPEYTSPLANAGSPKFNYSPGNNATGANALVFPATSVPMNAARAAEAGILTPTPLPAARSDDEVLWSVQRQLERLDPEANPRIEHMRPVRAGELQEMGIVGPDNGDQVFVVVQCNNCSAKAVIPTTQDELQADVLTFICERHYAGNCRVIAGKDNERTQRIRSVPNRVTLPTVVPRRGVAALEVEPPFAR